MSGATTRDEGHGRPTARPDPAKRAHGLQNRFNFDLGRLGRLAKAGVARMTATVSAIDLPFQEAIDFLRQKTKTPTRSWRDVWDGAHSKMFMVAGANTEALVGDFQEAIAKALEKGTTLDEFRRDFDAIVKTHGWSYKGERGWRTRTIFETNLRTAYAAGRYAQMTKPETLEAFPYWSYRHSGSLHPRLNHKAWDGQVYSADDPFWKTNYPPNGFGCGCFVVPVSAGGLKRLGRSGPDTSPDLDQPGTDQPLGVDPSFAYNPGEAWLRQTAPGPKAVSASEANVAAFVASSLRGKWPDGAWTPVAVTDASAAAELAIVQGAEIRLAAETIRASFAAEQADLLATMPRWLIKNGTVTKGKRGRWTIRGERDGRTYEMELQAGRDPKRPHLMLRTLK